MLTKIFNLELKSVENSDKRVLTFIGTNSNIDRDKEIIDVNGWNFDNYLKNPVVLFGHDFRQPPVGKTTRITKEGGNLVFDIEFPGVGKYPHADIIYNLAKDKFLNAASVGFKPTKHEDIQDTEKGGNIRKFVQQELIELSIVPFGSNPTALQKSGDYMAGMETYRELLIKELAKIDEFAAKEETVKNIKDYKIGDDIKELDVKLSEVLRLLQDTDGIKPQSKSIGNNHIKKDESYLDALLDLGRKLESIGGKK